MANHFCQSYLASGRRGGRLNASLAYLVLGITQNKNGKALYCSMKNKELALRILNEHCPHLVTNQIDIGVEISFPKCEL